MTKPREPVPTVAFVDDYCTHYRAVFPNVRQFEQFILPSSGSLAFLDAFGLPMEQRGGADALALTLEVGAAGELDVFQLLDRGEMPVDQAGVGQRPEVFSGLQFWGVGWQEQQVGAIRFSETACEQGMGSTPRTE